MLWIELVQHRVEWPVFVLEVFNLSVLSNRELVTFIKSLLH